MVMLSCALCQEQWCLVSTLCEDCHKVRQLANLYGAATIHKTLNEVFLRKEQGIARKTDAVAKEGLKDQIRPKREDIV